MHLIDDTGSLFRPPPVAFRASEIGLDAFGWNIENADLVESLAAAVARRSADHASAEFVHRVRGGGWTCGHRS